MSATVDSLLKTHYSLLIKQCGTPNPDEFRTGLDAVELKLLARLCQSDQTLSIIRTDRCIKPSLYKWATHDATNEKIVAQWFLICVYDPRPISFGPKSRKRRGTSVQCGRPSVRKEICAPPSRTEAQSASWEKSAGFGAWVRIVANSSF